LVKKIKGKAKEKREERRLLGKNKKGNKKLKNSNCKLQIDF
jgi:hypothetical protein